MSGCIGTYVLPRRIKIVVGLLRGGDTKEVREVDMAAVAIEIMSKGEVDPTLVPIVEKLVTCNGFVLNHMCFVLTARVLNMS
jgi:hypothetical protein